MDNKELGPIIDKMIDAEIEAWEKISGLRTLLQGMEHEKHWDDAYYKSLMMCAQLTNFMADMVLIKARLYGAQRDG